MDPLAFRLKNYAEVEPISGKPFSSKALRECYAQGAERFGWARRPLAPRQMRDDGGTAGRLGRRHRDLPGADVPGPGARRAARATAPAWSRSARTTWARAPATALAQIAADGLGLDIDAGRVPLRRVRPSRRRHRRRLRPIPRPPAWRSTTPAADVIAKLADLATARRALAAVRRRQRRRRSRATAGCTAATTRAAARATREILAPRRPRARSRARAASAADPGRASGITPCMRTARCSPRSRSIPISGRSASTRLVGAFAAGRVINPRLVRSQYLRRHDLGRVLRAARAARSWIRARAGSMNANLGEYHVPVNADVPVAGGDPGRGARPPRQCARDQGRRRDRGDGHGGRGRQCGLARDRRARPPVPDRAGAAARSGGLSAAGLARRAAGDLRSRRAMEVQPK